MPDVLRICVYGVLCGVISVSIYAWISNQRRIAELKRKARDLRARVLADDIDHRELLRLTRSNLATSFRLLGRTFVPAVVSALPVILAIEWISIHHSFDVPEPGERIRITAVPHSSSLTAAPDNIEFGKQDEMWLAVPDASGQILLCEDGVEVYAGNPFDAPTAYLQKKKWWNAVMPSRAGYLSADSTIQAVHFEFAKKLFFQNIPEWLATWHFSFFAALVITAVTLRLRFRIS